MGNQTIRRCRSQRDSNPSCHSAPTYAPPLQTKREEDLSDLAKRVRLSSSGIRETSSKVTLLVPLPSIPSFSCSSSKSNQPNLALEDKASVITRNIRIARFRDNRDSCKRFRSKCVSNRTKREFRLAFKYNFILDA